MPRRRREHDVRGAVPPGLLEREGQAAIRQLAQAVVRDGRPGEVLDQALEAADGDSFEDRSCKTVAHRGRCAAAKLRPC